MLKNARFQDLYVRCGDAHRLAPENGSRYRLRYGNMSEGIANDRDFDDVTNSSGKMSNLRLRKDVPAPGNYVRARHRLVLDLGCRRWVSTEHSGKCLDRNRASGTGFPCHV